MKVNRVESSSGKVGVAIYEEPKGFLKFEKAVTSNSVEANKGTTEITIEDLPNGTYALAVFHDENGNGELDTNWLGIPKEKMGFSNAKMKTFGPPSFKDCAFQIDSDTEITVVID
ncbi:MAG: DUF2141 domain-containing protein [Saonia sp.]